MTLEQLFADFDNLAESAVKEFWDGRESQKLKQLASGRSDQGQRGAATGGKHFDSLLNMIVAFLKAAGVPDTSIYNGKKVEIPGYYRATKQWDLLVVHQGKLLAAVEAKAQVGSFGNNGNNRVEEALGSSTDFWRAQKEELFGGPNPPWLGYIFVLEDAPKSKTVVRVAEPHFKALPEFKTATYTDRMQILCRKLVAERQYSAAAFILTSKADLYQQPDPEIGFLNFVKALVGHVQARL